MSVLERWVIHEMTGMYRRSRQPVRTRVLADRIGKHDRTVRALLTRLEQKGLVRRRGQRGGWLPVC